jgi:FkbM family methyltransferase
LIQGAGLLVKVDDAPQPIFLYPTANVRWVHESHAELAIGNMFHTVLKPASVSSAGIAGSPRMVDVGANDGFDSMLAAAYGARVVAFEPQLLCVMRLQIAIAAHPHYAHAPLLYRNLVAASPTEFYVSDGVCKGTQQYAPGGGGAGGALDWLFYYLTPFHEVEPRQVKSLVKSVRLDDAVQNDDIYLLHIDAEGAEIPVLESARALIETRKIYNVIFEWHPTRFAQFDITLARAKRVVEHLITSQHYECREASSFPAAAGSSTQQQQLPSMATVTPISSVQDLIDRYMGDAELETDLWCTRCAEFKLSAETAGGAGSPAAHECVRYN